MLDANYERAYCLGIVEKLSGLGYKYNKRLLILYNGILAYYSKVPPEAETGSMKLATFKELPISPKLSIECKYIKAVKPADPSLKKKKNFVFVVEFRKAAFISNNKKDNAKNDQELRWVFAVNDESSLDKWTSLIEQVKTSQTINNVDRSPSPLTKRQNALQTGENSKPVDEKRPGPIKSIKPRQNSTLPATSPPKTRDDSDASISPGKGKSSFARGDKSKKERRVQIKEVQNVYSVAPEDAKLDDRLLKKEEELRREREREEEMRRKQEEEREQRRQEELARAKEELAQEERLKQEQQEKLRIAWEYKYNLLMDENLKALLSIEDRIRTGFQLLRFIGSFRTEAVNLCRNIIDEFPSVERKFAAYEKTNIERNSKASHRVFFFQNIIVRITWAERESVDLGEDGYHYLYTDKTVKSYNHEFRAMDILNDVLYSLNKSHKDVVYRVPLAVRVDYKGFKCLVMSSPPVEGDETLQLGPMMSTGTYRVNKNIDDDLNFIARELNLKEHAFVLDDNSTEVNIPLSVFTELHKVVFSGFEDGNDVRNPTSSEAKLSFADRRVHDCFYFMKTSDLFPVDIDLEANNNPSFLRRLRPEFLLDYDKPLSADALLNNTGDNSTNENDDIEVVQAGIYLRTVTVPAFVKKLDSLELILVDSASLTEALHCHGINLRYLGLICQQTNLPHVKEVCITEMIARTVKKILRKEISDIVLQNSEVENESLSTSKERSGFLGRTSKTSSRRDEVSRRSVGKSLQKAVEIEQDIGDCVIEVLNLVFGKGKESTKFWSEIMTEQIMYDFNYDIKNFQKTEISLGGLLLAVVHYCHINIKWDSSIEELLDKVPNPFKKDCYEGVKAKSKVFSMHSLDVKSLSERYRQARASKGYDAAIKSCLLAMSIDKQMAVKGEGFEDPVLLGDMAEIYYENQQFDKACEMAKEGLKYSRTLHIEAVKCFCVIMRVYMIRGEMESTLKNFEQAIKHLNFHVGLYHPMHATVYVILGSYYAQKENFQDALFLYKASLVCCMRILGPNHPSTGEVYLDLGNLTLKMRQQEDALNYFEKAFYVFEASKGEDSIECASTSYMMATLLMSFGKVKEAMTSVQHAMRVYEKNEEDYVERIAECCLLVCNIGESRNDDKLTLEHANKIWNILNKIPTKNSMYYKSRILTLTLTALIHGLTTDKKNFLYIISDAIVDVLGQENKLDKLNGGGEDTTLQKEFLEIIFTKSQASKNIQNLIKDILRTLFQKLQEKDLKAFFRDYRRNLENLEDSQLKECLKDFEMLIFIHGIQYLNDAFKKF